MRFFENLESTKGTMLGVPFIVLNNLVLVGAGWLLILGEWKVFVGILIVMFTGIVEMLIGIILSVVHMVFFAVLSIFLPKGMEDEQPSMFTGMLLFLTNLSSFALQAIWYIFVLTLFMLLSENQTTHNLPFFLAAYGVATGPWVNLLVADMRSGQDTSSTAVALLLMNLFFAGVISFVYFGGDPLSGNSAFSIWVWIVTIVTTIIELLKMQDMR